MSGDDDSVIESLEARRGRARREPPPRRPARGTLTPPLLTDDAAPTGTSAEASRPPRSARKSPAASTKTGATPVEASGGAPARSPNDPSASADRETPLRLGPDEPIANFAVRVRRSLDDLVAWRLAELRRQGIRTTKVELTEMLLWELSSESIERLHARLLEFRQNAPR